MSAFTKVVSEKLTKRNLHIEKVPHVKLSICAVGDSTVTYVILRSKIHRYEHGI